MSQLVSLGVEVVLKGRLRDGQRLSGFKAREVGPPRPLIVSLKSGQAEQGRVGIVDHRGEILMNTFVYVNPKNVRDYLTDSACAGEGE